MAHEIKQVEVKNWRSIVSLSAKIGKRGAVARGRGDTGKSSFLDAMRACLTTAGVDPAAIRNGTDQSEILIDLDHASVRLTVTKDGTTRSVTPAAGGKVLRGATALAHIRELFPGGAVDPFVVMLAKTAAEKRERRDAIAAATPCTVTIEDIRKYVPNIPADYDCSGHGLDVIAGVREIAYKARTTANAKRDADAAEADRARRAVPDAVEGSADVHAAAERENEAVTALGKLRSQNEQAAAAIERTAASRDRAKDLRTQAAIYEDRKGVSEEERAAAVETQKRASVEVERASEALREAQRALDAATGVLKEAMDNLAHLDSCEQGYQESIAKAKDLRGQAEEIERTVASASAATVDDATMAAAIEEREQARTNVARAVAAKAHADAVAVSEASAATAVASTAEAARLDGIVKALTDEAPAAILAAANGIPGLTLDGDKVLLDGVDLDMVSGSKRMRLAVEVAKRTAGRSKLLIIDGLERLADEQLDEFMGYATADGWTLVGSQVANGSMQIVALESGSVNGTAKDVVTP